MWGQMPRRKWQKKIKQCKMKIYEGLGHGAYDETEDFNRQVMDFLNETALEENV